MSVRLLTSDAIRIKMTCVSLSANVFYKLTHVILIRTASLVTNLTDIVYTICTKNFETGICVKSALPVQQTSSEMLSRRVTRE